MDDIVDKIVIALILGLFIASFGYLVYAQCDLMVPHYNDDGVPIVSVDERIHHINEDTGDLWFEDVRFVKATPEHYLEVMCDNGEGLILDRSGNVVPPDTWFEMAMYTKTLSWNREWTENTYKLYREIYDQKMASLE